MRQWVEKLAKHLENEGVWTEKPGILSHNYEIRTNKYFVSIWTGYHELRITNLHSSNHTTIKIYEDEVDLLSKVRDKVMENTTDSIINELNNLD